MESSDARAFHVLAGDIESKENVGLGILGEIYVAKHKHWGPVWIKEMAVSTSVTTNAAKKLRKEAEVLKNLRHKNIVQLMGMIWEPLPKHYALVFEPARYGILADFMEMNARLDINLKIAFMYDAALGMSYLHSIRPPVIHRDLRWNLVQVHEHFVLKISDFGLAEWINYSRSHSNNRYSHGPTFHIAPECWRDINLKPSWKTDMYSFAVLCWSIAVQEEPYKYLVSAEQIRTAVLDGQRPNLDDLPADCIPELRGWLTSWWAQDPDRRPTFGDVAAILDQYTQEHEQSIQDAKIRLYRRGGNNGATGDIAEDGNESLQEQPSFNFNACAAERLAKINSKDLSGSDFGSQQETSVKRISASASLQQNDVEEDGDESPVKQTLSQTSSTTARGYKSDSARSSSNNLSSHDGSMPGAYGRNPENFTSGASFGKHPSPDWKMPNVKQIHSAGPTSMYESTSETGQTQVYNFGNVSNFQIGDRNLMTVTTHKTSGKTTDVGGSGASKANTTHGTKVRKYKITSSKKVLDDKNMDMLKRELGRHWKELARQLGFSDGEIDTFDIDYGKYGLSETIQQFLRQWKEKMANQATLCAVADALIQMKLFTVAAKLDDSH